MIALSLEVEGMAAAQAVLDAAAKLGSNIGGAELLGKPRLDRPGMTNADVEDFLRQGGRDFCKPTKALEGEIGRLMERRFAKELARVQARNKKQKKPVKMTKGQATAVCGIAVKAALQHWMKWAADNIDAGRTADGGQADKVDPIYAARRQKKYNVPTDAVGKATGELYENLTDKGAIRVLKHATK